jgi:hypothetical protein
MRSSPHACMHARRVGQVRHRGHASPRTLLRSSWQGGAAHARPGAWHDGGSAIRHERLQHDDVLQLLAAQRWPATCALPQLWYSGAKLVHPVLRTCKQEHSALTAAR